MKKRSFWRWLRELFQRREVFTCPHLFWPELSGGKQVGRRCSTCGKYETMAEVQRKRRAR